MVIQQSVNNLLSVAAIATRTSALYETQQKVHTLKKQEKYAEKQAELKKFDTVLDPNLTTEEKKYGKVTIDTELAKQKADIAQQIFDIKPNENTYSQMTEAQKKASSLGKLEDKLIEQRGLEQVGIEQAEKEREAGVIHRASAPIKKKVSAPSKEEQAAQKAKEAVQKEQKRVVNKTPEEWVEHFAKLKAQYDNNMNPLKKDLNSNKEDQMNV